MNCNCPDDTYVQSTVEGTVICTKTTTITNVVCPDGCTPVILENGNVTCNCYQSVEPIMVDELVPIRLTDPLYFKDVSFTVGYSTLLKKWISYYSFAPNYYISHQDYFQTGLNNPNDSTEHGLWSHLLTNKSYQVFYGKKYNFEIEYPDKNSYNTRTLNSVSIWSEARRYHDRYSYAYSPYITFNETVIYNNVCNSGKLNLVPQKGNLVFNNTFPKTNNNNTQDILISNKDNFEWSYDYIFNRVKNNVSNEPNFMWDDNQIYKTVNPKAVSFHGKRVLDNISGDYFLIDLIYNKDSRYKLIHKWGTQNYSV